MTAIDASTTDANPTQPAPRTKGKRDWLHYAAYFVAVGALTFIAKTEEPRQIEDALLAGAVASGAVVSRDWYKARLDPNMADDPNGFIALFSEMLHAGRAQANSNAGQLKRVSFLQADLIEAMRDLNDLLRLEPDEVERRLKAIQTAHLSSALPTIAVPNPLAENAIHNSTVPPTPAGDTYIPDSTTLRQSDPLRRPGFDA